MLYSKDDIVNVFKNDELYISTNSITINSITIDSRILTNGGMFFAIKGENNDGHKYIKSAVENGAVCVVCERLPEDYQSINASFVVVKNSIEALTKLAIFQRNRLRSKVIAITGNVGKTSTRANISFVLSQFYKTYTPIRNFNNHIGLPFAIANAPTDTEMLVLEMGMNHPGEIAHLTKIAKPDIAIITNIVPVHMEFMKNLDTVARAKAEIFQGMSPNSYAILNEDNDSFGLLKSISEENGVKNILSVGTKNSDVFIDGYEFMADYKTNYKVSICSNTVDSNTTYSNVDCTVNGMSYHNAFNTLFVFAVAKILNLNFEKVADAVKQIKIVDGRGNLEDIKCDGKSIKIINDAYNSSPVALRDAVVALGTFAAKNQTRSVAILGDMLELGAQSKEYHKSILPYILESGINVVITIGKEMKAVFDELQDVEKYHFDETKQALSGIRNVVKDGDVVLLKASRGMHFETIIDELKRQ
ncbi:MAG: UDP-N-acetylmuramoyl-tripeptide--D-alanyl-D-alanine ligase [Rickettsiales bacterium]|nr:UDP-N-acetylmuramoyl-tripeptide--D-alanyl-D-alanine ligase [Rickettsiales bacterium]